MKQFKILFVLFYMIIPSSDGLGVSWDWGKWWTYDGISGPQFWGLINPEWSLCTHGRRQSPVNLEPSLLLYDPNLRKLNIDRNQVSGTVNNTGHSVVFTLDEEMDILPREMTGHVATIGAGGGAGMQYMQPQQTQPMQEEVEDERLLVTHLQTHDRSRVRDRRRPRRSQREEVKSKEENENSLHDDGGKVNKEDRNNESKTTKSVKKRDTSATYSRNEGVGSKTDTGYRIESYKRRGFSSIGSAGLASDLDSLYREGFNGRTKLIPPRLRYNNGHVFNSSNSIAANLHHSNGIYDPNHRFIEKSNRGSDVPNPGNAEAALNDESLFAGLTDTSVRTTKTPTINVTGGPLSYRYQVTHVQLHFGSQDNIGSEHAVNNTPFPAEVQIFAYNSQLFKNYTEAVSRAHGIVVIAIMVQIGAENLNPELKILTDAIEKIKFAGTSTRIHRLSVAGLLPTTEYYLTYEGSLTQPPCHETVTWLIVNKPVYMSRNQLHTLRMLHQGTARTPKAKMVNNYRPTQQLHHRPLRTNIDFNSAEYSGEKKKGACPSMGKQMYYTANTFR